MIANVNKFKGFKSLGGYGSQREYTPKGHDLKEYKKQQSRITDENATIKEVLENREKIKKRFEKDKEIEYDLSEKQKQFFVPLIQEQKELIKPFIPLKDMIQRNISEEHKSNNIKVEEDPDAEDSFSSLGQDANAFNPLVYIFSITDRSLAPYSLRYNKNSDTYSLGDSAVVFNNNYNQILLKDKTYQTTPGLLELLTKKSPNTEICTTDDKNNYKEMLIKTNALFHNYDPNAKKFNTDSSEKWKLIRHTLLPGMFKAKIKPASPKVEKVKTRQTTKENLEKFASQQ